MSAGDWLLLVVAGVAGGLAGSIAGLASLTTYPALLAVGLGPIAANVTNTTALVFSTLGSTLGSRPELEGQAARLRPLVVAGVLGGATGATLLLLTPSDTFERIAVADLEELLAEAWLARAPKRLAKTFLDARG